MRLYFDFETRSEVDLKGCGLDNYLGHPSTQALLLAYAFDDDPVQLHDFTVDPVFPGDVWSAIESQAVRKVAWNATFEVGVCDKLYDMRIDLRQWLDPMVLARHMTLPGSLGGCTDALQLPTAKDKAGKALIKMFSMPSKATAKMRKAGQPDLYWRDRVSDPEQWEHFKDYARTDVDSMREALQVMESHTELPSCEHLLWRLDAAINDRGLPVDAVYVDRAHALMRDSDALAIERLRTLTGCNNPNSAVQLKAWLEFQGCPMPSIAAEVLEQSLAGSDLPPQVREALRARQLLGGAGPKKLAAIKALVSADGRLRNQFVFCGLRTGRWSSRGVQVQNLPRPSRLASEHCEAITDAICFGEPMPVEIDTVDAVTSTIRSAFRARDGYKLLVSDCPPNSSIENRLLAWVAGCETMAQVYRDGKDAYKAFASLIYRKPYGDVSKQERSLAKPAVLGCGYGMSASRLTAYADSMGIVMDESIAQEHVDLFRCEYREVPALWYAFGDLASRAVRDRSCYSHASGVAFDRRDERYLSIRLPSGRKLYYLTPAVETVETPWGDRETLTFWSGGSKGFLHERTHGAKIVENVIQAIARDILADGLLRATRAGYNIIAHIHDEIVCEEPDEGLNVGGLEAVMSSAPAWATGLTLDAKCFETQQYRKD